MIERTVPVGHALVESLLVIAQVSLCVLLIVVLFDRARLTHINLETVRLDSDRCAVTMMACDQSIPFVSYQENVEQVDTRLSRLIISGTVDIEREVIPSRSDIGWHQSVSQANLALVRYGLSGVTELFELPDTSLFRSTSATAKANIDVLGRTATNFRLVTLPDAWYATGGDAELRVRRGADPLPVLASLLEATFIPTKDVLMPVAEFIGLERQTASFREAFHREGWFNPVEGSLAGTPQGVRQ